MCVDSHSFTHSLGVGVAAALKRLKIRTFSGYLYLILPEREVSKLVYGLMLRNVFFWWNKSLEEMHL